MIKLGILSLEHPHSTGNHIPALIKLKDSIKVSAIMDTDRERAKQWTSLFSADYYDDISLFLENSGVDACLVTSRNIDHANDAIACALAGKDVLCDKPVATCVTDALRIIGTVHDTGVVFLTTFPVRYNTSVIKLKKMIEKGSLGRIKAIAATNHGCMYEPGCPSWVKDPVQNGGGCLVDHTVHVADIIRWITKQEFATVYAQKETFLHPIEAEDIGMLHGQLTDGTVYQIDASWSRKSDDPMWGDVTFRVVGTEGTADLDLYNNHRLEIYREGNIKYNYINYLCREHGDLFMDYCIYKETGRRMLCADALDGLRTVELVSAAYRSAAEGRLVEIELNHPGS